MKEIYIETTDDEKVQMASAQILWSHNETGGFFRTKFVQFSPNYDIMSITDYLVRLEESILQK